MFTDESNVYYRRYLPHYQPKEATFHVVFRLAGSLPRKVIADLKEEREQMKKELAKAKDMLEQNRLRRDFRGRMFEKYEALIDGSS